MKQMHHAVANLGKAKGALEQAHLARNRLHGQWLGYVKESVQRWEKYITEFQQEDAALHERIGKAREHLQQAKEAFELIQKNQGVEVQPVDNAEAEEMQQEEVEQKTSSQIDTGLQNVLAGLKDLQRLSEEISVPGEGGDQKRLKLSEGGVLSSPSMRPFPPADS